jgi:hypothetical protein
MRKFMTSLVCSLLCVGVVHADGDEKKTMYAAATTVERPQWRQTSVTMTSGEYQETVAHNRDILQDQLEDYAGRLLNRTGGYGRAAGLFGAAVAVAVTDRRYSLNDSRTLGMVLRDTVSSDRTVLLEYRRHW